MIDTDSVLPTPEVYDARPVLLMTEDESSELYGMVRYRAGRGSQPALDDEVVLSVFGPPSYSFVDGERVDHPPEAYVQGLYAVVEVSDSQIKSPYVRPPDGLPQFWGVTVRKVRDLEEGDEIDRAEAAVLLTTL